MWLTLQGDTTKPGEILSWINNQEPVTGGLGGLPPCKPVKRRGFFNSDDSISRTTGRFIRFSPNHHTTETLKFQPT